MTRASMKGNNNVCKKPRWSTTPKNLQQQSPMGDPWRYVEWYIHNDMAVGKVISILLQALLNGREEANIRVVTWQLGNSEW
ncbi:hypothetical protein GOP47_0009357 [Adiantum capillus-veneris]|uniref:Uncharacterized protein n=1 Tax=Adiantum capillus-veneris TaxID=13818 RepID=A0A9D4ZJF8_ADICA|nr:hypothetical protein GOP47_0009357 [Adiantum capillus-veneris]